MSVVEMFWTFFSGLATNVFNGWVWIPIGVLVLLRVLRVKMFAWAFAWWAALWFTFEYCFQTPVPASVIGIYMGIATLAIAAYVSSSERRVAEFIGPVRALVTEKRWLPVLGLLLLAIPAAAAANVWIKMRVPLEAPSFGRTVHPSPPASIEVGESTIDLRTADNPFRHLKKDDPEEYARRVEAGRATYYENCFYCHGDDLYGNGMFAYGLNPIPTNFQDKGVLPNFQESFFFWRIAKGAPGLPDEGGPWDSAMPVWEQFLTEDEMWEVVLFLYDFAGYEPRALSEEVHH